MKSAPEGRGLSNLDAKVYFACKKATFCGHLGGGGRKLVKLCRCSLWMASKLNALFVLRNNA